MTGFFKFVHDWCMIFKSILKMYELITPFLLLFSTVNNFLKYLEVIPNICLLVGESLNNNKL